MLRRTHKGSLDIGGGYCPISGIIYVVSML